MRCGFEFYSFRFEFEIKTMNSFQLTKIKLTLIIGLLVVVASLWLIPGPDREGATVRVIFEEEIHQGQERQAMVMVDSNVEVNSVDVSVVYPTELLEAQQADMDGAYFDTQIFEPEIQGPQGKVRFVQATLEPFEGEDGLVGTIDFKAYKQGKPEFQLDSAQVIAHDGQGTNVYYPKLQRSMGEWVSDFVAQKFGDGI